MDLCVSYAGECLGGIIMDLMISKELCFPYGSCRMLAQAWDDHVDTNARDLGVSSLASFQWPVSLYVSLWLVSSADLHF